MSVIGPELLNESGGGPYTSTNLEKWRNGDSFWIDDARPAERLADCIVLFSLYAVANARSQAVYG